MHTLKVAIVQQALSNKWIDRGTANLLIARGEAYLKLKREDGISPRNSSKLMKSLLRYLDQCEGKREVPHLAAWANFCGMTSVAFKKEHGVNNKEDYDECCAALRDKQESVILNKVESGDLPPQVGTHLLQQYAQHSQNIETGVIFNITPDHLKLMRTGELEHDDKDIGLGVIHDVDAKADEMEHLLEAADANR